MSNRLPRTANLAAAGSPTNILPPSPAPARPAPRTPAAAHFQLPLAFALPAAGAPLLTPLQRATPGSLSCGFSLLPLLRAPTAPLSLLSADTSELDPSCLGLGRAGLVRVGWGAWPGRFAQFRAALPSAGHIWELLHLFVVASFPAPWPGF